MLDRLDVCLEYLKANVSPPLASQTFLRKYANLSRRRHSQRDFKDAEIYLIRFQQCLTRSMTLIKMYFVTIIRKLTNEVFEKMAGKVSFLTVLPRTTSSSRLRLYFYFPRNYQKQPSIHYSIKNFQMYQKL